MASFKQSEFEINQLPEHASSLGMSSFEIDGYGYTKNSHAEAACDEDSYITTIQDDQGLWHCVSGK